jgi:predicted small secreted protein
VTGARALRRASLPILVVLAAVLLSACGGSETGSGSDELARQHELSAARHQAAQDARQATRIKQLERELHKVAHQKSGPPAAASLSPAGPPPQEQEPTELPTTDWPGGTGFTAILASVSSEAEARSIEAEATGRGLDAGVLFSSDYSSLRPGYWVVFSGAFTGVEDAEARAAHAQELGYSDAYPRFVAP